VQNRSLKLEIDERWKRNQFGKGVFLKLLLWRRICERILHEGVLYRQRKSRGNKRDSEKSPKGSPGGMGAG